MEPLIRYEGYMTRVLTGNRHPETRDVIATLEKDRPINQTLTARTLRHALISHGTRLDYISDDDYETLLGENDIAFGDRVIRLLEIKDGRLGNTLHLLTNAVPLWERVMVMNQLLQEPERRQGEDFIRAIQVSDSALWPVSHQLVEMLEQAADFASQNQLKIHTVQNEGKAYANQLREYIAVIDSTQQRGLRDGLFGEHYDGERYDFAIRLLNKIPMELRPLDELCNIALTYRKQGNQAPAQALSATLPFYSIDDIKACLDEVCELCSGMESVSEQKLAVDRIIDSQIKLNRMDVQLFQTLLPPEHYMSAHHLFKEPIEGDKDKYQRFIDVDYALDVMTHSKGSGILKPLDPEYLDSTAPLQDLKEFGQALNEMVERVVKEQALSHSPTLLITDEAMQTFQREYIHATDKMIRGLDLHSFFSHCIDRNVLAENPLTMIEEAINQSKPFLKKSMLHELNAKQDGVSLHEAIVSISELATTLSRCPASSQKTVKQLNSISNRVERMSGYIFKQMEPERTRANREITQDIMDNTL